MISLKSENSKSSVGSKSHHVVCGYSTGFAGATRTIAVIINFYLPGVLLLTLYSSAAPGGTRAPDDGSNPNIIIILADDLGYGDLGGYYGGRAHAPRINRMAQEGMLFTDFHSSGPACSPTRAALLTGQYPQRLGIESALSVIKDVDKSGLVRGVGSDANAAKTTVAEYLREAGYATAYFGKWHLGNHPAANPVHHGFDEFRGLLSGCGDYFSKINRYGTRDWWHNTDRYFQEGYTTEVITDNTLDFIAENKEHPFFAVVAHLAVHFPWQTPEDGALETRGAGEEFTTNYPGAGSKLGPHMPAEIPVVLTRMIEELDLSVGQILDALAMHGLDERTLVLFTSDNGGYLHYNGDVWPKVGSNGPLRGQKAQTYEGGHRVPAIAWWPGKIAPLSTCDQTALTFDILPTVMDIAGTETFDDSGPDLLDGVSLLPALLQGTRLPQRQLFWRFNDRKAVREGHWKLVIPSKEEEAELYDLSRDIGEQQDLSEKWPDTVRRFTTALEAWEKRVDGK